MVGGIGVSAGFAEAARNLVTPVNVVNARRQAVAVKEDRSVGTILAHAFVGVVYIASLVVSSPLVHVEVYVAEQRQCIDQAGQCSPHFRTGKGIPRSRGSHEGVCRNCDFRDHPHECVLGAL